MNTTICCLEPVLAPYSIPRFRALQRLRPDYVVDVMALGATERMREWNIEKSDVGFEYAEAVPGKTLEDLDPAVLAARVTGWLDARDPAAVAITGYYYPAMRAAAKWAKRHARLSIYMGDSQWRDRRRNPVKEWIKGWWVRRHFDAGFVAGERAAAYLQRLGCPLDRIWTGYDVVDNDRIAGAVSTARDRADEGRRALGVPTRYFLFVGRLSPEKNLPRLIEAYAAYRRGAGPSAWGLVLVGGGPQDGVLRRLAQATDGIVFAGFQQADRVADYYGLASCLVLPSLSETWGLVVNEAMAAGLPVLVSHRCGCVPELVRQGSNGYLCDPLDTHGIARAMAVLASSAVDLAAMGAASRQRVSLYTPETWAKALADCVDRLALRARRPVPALPSIEVVNTKQPAHGDHRSVR